jgi:L-threonylcarbamoyladenylate synthase
LQEAATNSSNNGARVIRSPRAFSDGPPHLASDILPAMPRGTIERAVDVLLHAAGLVAFPTETVYGLGADALNPRAVARIFEAKQRPTFDPLIVHVRRIEDVEELTSAFPETARQLAKRFWPGPLTLVLPKRPLVPDLVTAGQPTVAVRIPAHPLALELLERAQIPIAAPSANRFGSVSPTTAEHVEEQLGDAVDVILDGGPCAVGVESTIISLASDRPLLLRPGGTSLEEIEALIGEVEIPPPDQLQSAAPGRLAKHYATRTPLQLAAAGIAGKRAGLLALTEPEEAAPYDAIEVLSPTGDLREAAANLFAAMRRLDAAGLDVIVATEVPEVGLGRAINDRLRRASCSSLPGA